MPDVEMESMLLNVFGRRGIPLRKYWRMMYWMPKFKNLSPWRLPQKLPNDAIELAKLAIQRITSVDNDTVLSTFHVSIICIILFNFHLVKSFNIFGLYVHIYIDTRHRGFNRSYLDYISTEPNAKNLIRK